ncbi:MAG TPA: hypothetical protein VGG69_11755 [Rhizomicrobium sp.]
MGDKTSAEKNKRDLRDAPATSLRDTDTESPIENPERAEGGGPHTVKPGVGAQAPGQTTRQ